MSFIFICSFCRLQFIICSCRSIDLFPGAEMHERDLFFSIRARAPNWHWSAYCKIRSPVDFTFKFKSAKTTNRHWLKPFHTSSYQILDISVDVLDVDCSLLIFLSVCKDIKWPSQPPDVSMKVHSIIALFGEVLANSSSQSWLLHKCHDNRRHPSFYQKKLEKHLSACN